MRKLNIAHAPDIHVGAKVMAPFVMYETVWLNIVNAVNFQEAVIDVFVIGGDLFDSKFPENSDEVEVAKMIVEDAARLAKTVVILKGTDGHDRDMLEYLKPLTKHGAVYEVDTSKIERQIINDVKAAKELVISGKEEALHDKLLRLTDMLSDKLKHNKDSNNVYIFEKPTYLTINDYKILFCPEIYDINDEYISSVLDGNPDIMFYHGMMEGALEHYHESKTSLIYNRSITLTHSNLKKVRMFTVAGHIHGRVSILPYVPSRDMYTKSRGLKAWYTGNPYQSTFADAGTKKGFDIIRAVGDVHEVEFNEITGGPSFHIYDFTAEFRSLDLIQLNAAFIKAIKGGGHIRIDVDTSFLTEADDFKINTMRAKFPNLKYKIFNSKEQINNEKNIRKAHDSLISKPIKEIVLELCEGKITEEDYKYFFDEE